MSELINRPEYLEQLIQNKDVDLVKIVTGIRRCGKSSLLDLFHQYLSDSGTDDSHIIHMNMESLRYRELSDYLGAIDDKSPYKFLLEEYGDWLELCHNNGIPTT